MREKLHATPFFSSAWRFLRAFYEDANLIAKELNLTLTKRQDIPMSGVPCHTCETYIDKLVAKGYRVAVAEQMEDPKTHQRHRQTRSCSCSDPGTLIASSLLSDKSNNYFVSVIRVNSLYGLAFLD